MSGERDAPKYIAGQEGLAAYLSRRPGRFSFAQAVRLLRKAALADESRSLSAPGAAEKLRFKVNPNLSFPPSDIYAVEASETDDGPLFQVTMNLMGLHGSASPLPNYFTEYVAQRQDDDVRLRDFLDLFNHRLICVFFDVWLKYRYQFQFQGEAEDRLSRRFFSFMGLGHAVLREDDDLDFTKLLPYMGLIAFSGDSVGSLESILRHYFGHGEVYIAPCIERLAAIPEDQKSRLGEANSSLGGDCLLGEGVPDQMGKFRVLILDLNWELFNKFLPDGETFHRLACLVRFIMRSPLSFDVELRLRQDEIKPLTIGEESRNRLAWSSWLGEAGDGVARLETGL